MGQPLQAWKRIGETGNERLWLSMLIDAMEQVSRPELRAKPCDGAVLAGLRAQLALPASIRSHPPSACGTNHPAVAATLFAGDLQPWPRVPLPPAQPCFLIADVVAGHRHDALALGELELEVHHVLIAER